MRPDFSVISSAFNIAAKSISFSGDGARRRTTKPPPFNVHSSPPSAAEIPFAGELRLPHAGARLVRAADPIPISIRRRRRRPNSPENDDPVCGAVFSLACVMEELSALAVSGCGDDAAVARIYSDTGNSVVWSFEKVFSSSPNLFVGLLGLFGQFASVAARSAIPPAASVIGELGEALDVSPPAPDIDGEFERRRVAYERMIVSAEKPDSLILSNYAQLLYQFAGDMDRAEEYFRRAVAAEPVDPEAASRYAEFLWKERGDLEKAEEMMLEAIDMDPENIHYQSVYAGFLWNTGASDTCFIGGGGDGPEERIQIQW